MKIAAFTTVFNEPIFLPLWLGHYGRELGRENLFVLDDGSADGSTSRLTGGANVVRLARAKRRDEDDRALLISRCQATLLRRYDVVIYVDSDEFLIPDPARFSGLRHFIEQKSGPFMNAVGVDLIHVPELEPGLDLTRPVLSQRSFARFSGPYCKPAISRIPLRYEAGFHACQHAPRFDPDLYLFHLKRLDENLARARLRAQPVVWSAQALEKGHGEDHRLGEDGFIARHFNLSAAEVYGLAEGFDFSEEIAVSAAVSPKAYNPREGKVVRIPARFRASIEPACFVEDCGSGSRSLRMALHLTVMKHRMWLGLRRAKHAADRLIGGIPPLRRTKPAATGESYHHSPLIGDSDHAMEG